MAASGRVTGVGDVKSRSTVTKTDGVLIGAALSEALSIVVLIALWLISLIFHDDIAGSPGAVSRMRTARWNHTATLLPNGKVLIVGGLARVANAMMSVSPGLRLFVDRTAFIRLTSLMNTLSARISRSARRFSIAQSHANACEAR